MLKIFVYSLILCISFLVAGCSSASLSAYNRQSPVSDEIAEKNQYIPSETTNVDRYKINLPSPAGDVPTVDFEIATPFPQFSDQIQVYKVEKPEITAKYLANIGAKLGLSGEFKTGNYEFYLSVGSKSLEVFMANGGIFYHTDPLFPTEKPVLPSEDEAITIATNILAKIEQLPDGLEGTCEGIGESVGGPEGNWPISLTVVFKREINGNHFVGPGAKYQVRIGDKGEVRQIMINPVKYSLQEMVKLKNVDQAFAEMKTAKKYLVPSESEKVQIDKITTDYWLESMITGQEYIVPVYHFSGQCLGKFGKVLDSQFTGYVEAVQ
jgi:hypothetical protein